MTNSDHIPKIHALYETLTGHRIMLTLARHWPWECWLLMVKHHGIEPEAALRAVVAHLRRGIREQRRHEGCLKFSNLIQNLETAEEDLAEALARARFKPSTTPARDSVLRSAGRPPSPKGEGRGEGGRKNSQSVPIAEVIKKMREAAL